MRFHQKEKENTPLKHSIKKSVGVDYLNHPNQLTVIFFKEGILGVIRVDDMLSIGKTF